MLSAIELPEGVCAKSVSNPEKSDRQVDEYLREVAHKNNEEAANDKSGINRHSNCVSGSINVENTFANPRVLQGLKSQVVGGLHASRERL